MLLQAILVVLSFTVEIALLSNTIGWLLEGLRYETLEPFKFTEDHIKEGLGLALALNLATFIVWLILSLVNSLN